MSLTYVVVNLGRTKFVSTVIKDWVVFYVTLPRFWVGNLLNVNSEMRWVGFTLSNFRIVQDSLCWTNTQLFDDFLVNRRMVGKAEMQNVKSFIWKRNTEKTAHFFRFWSVFLPWFVTFWNYLLEEWKTASWANLAGNAGNGSVHRVVIPAAGEIKSLNHSWLLVRYCN